MTEITVSLAYERAGQGVPLILLHGYPLNRTIWKGVLPFLTDIADVIMPDLRGHGKSPIPEGEYSMETMAGDVIALMDSIGIETAVIAGHSMGGYVTLALLKYHPERLIAVGMVASQAAADSPEKYLARMESIEEIKISGPTAVTEGMLARLTRKEDILPELAEIISAATAQGLIGTLAGIAKREDALERLRSIKTPLMVISGAEDLIVPRERSAEIVRSSPNAWWVEILGSGHMPMMENPEATGLALRSLVVTTMVRQDI
jgi:pimeloyl-ACP methyl ester carboxylesterase